MTSLEQPTLAGMPVDPEEERWLALDRECDAHKERFRKYGRHTKTCEAQLVRLNGQAQNCVCGFEAEWARVFGPTTRSG